MSQGGTLSNKSGALANIETITGDTGGPVGPDVAFNLNLIGAESSDNDVNGITVAGTPGTNTEAVTLTNRLFGSGTTTGAITTNLVTFPLSVVPGAYPMAITIVGFDAADVAGASYTLTACFLTDGVNAVEVEITNFYEDEDLTLDLANWDIFPSANNIIVQVLGVAGKTINWRVLGTYIFVS